MISTLLAGSPAIDAGIDANAIATNDYDGVLRPQGGAFDIGAYEYISQTFHPADANQNNKIEMNELIAFIGKWKSAQATLTDVLTALDKWMRGDVEVIHFWGGTSLWKFVIINM